MSQDFDDELRKALRPVDPREGFADRVMSRIDSAPVKPSRRWWPQQFGGLPVALAASAVLCAVVVYGWQVDRERRGLEARRQLLEALHVTSQKLDLAYQGVMRESPPDTSGNDSGA